MLPVLIITPESWFNGPIISVSIEKPWDYKSSKRYHLCMWERILFIKSHRATENRSLLEVELAIVLILNEWTPTFANGYLPPEEPFSGDRNWHDSQSEADNDGQWTRTPKGPGQVSWRPSSSSCCATGTRGFRVSRFMSVVRLKKVWQMTPPAKVLESDSLIKLAIHLD